MAKTSKYLPAAIVGAIIIIIAGMQYFKKPAQEASGPGETGQEQNQANGKETDLSAPGNLAGTLKISDNLKRGNLMLVNAERVIYLFTSRDYSQLLDKEVKVQIEGTLDNFKLVDIVGK